MIVKPEGKIPLGTSRRRWENNIKIDLKKISWITVNWIYLPLDGVL
jgi:hypothetical protein